METILEMEVQRLDSLLQAVWGAALGGKLGAVDRVLSIMKRRAKLLALDAPDRLELAGPDGGPMQTESRTVDANLDLSAFEETDDPEELTRLYQETFRDFAVRCFT